MVEHQDRADAFEEGPQQRMGTAEIERVESGANDGRLHRVPLFRPSEISCNAVG